MATMTSSTDAASDPAASSTNPSAPLIIDTKHDDMVHDSQLDYYGCKLATSSSDRSVKIYDASSSNFTLTATILEHEGPVWEVSWAHPKFGVLLASCSFDGSVLIHREVSNGVWKLIHAAKSLHESSVNGVEFGPHEFGLVVAAASSDGRVSVLTHSGEDDSWAVEYVKDTPLGVNSVSWAPYAAYTSSDGNAAVEGEESKEHQSPFMRFVTGGCDNRIRFYSKSPLTNQWEEDSTSPTNTAVAHTDWVRDVAWAPSIVPGVNIVASCSEDRTVIIWTQNSPSGTWEPVLLNTFDAPVWRLSWSVTGNILAVSSGESSVTLWKQGLDGDSAVWTQVSTVADVPATSGAPGQSQQQG